MNFRLLCGGFFSKLRLPAALLLALTALPLLWAGLDLSLPQLLPGAALAGDARDNGRAEALALIPEQRLLLLQSSVDTLALGLGAALTGQERSERDADRLLGDVLNSLSFSLGSDLYFSAWQDTRIVHAPLNDDASGLDFAASLDGRGAPFVLAMRDMAGNGGGFLRVLLPPQRRPAQETCVSLPAIPEEGANDSPAAFCPFDGGCPLPGHDSPTPGFRGRDNAEACIEQVLYVRGIPGSERYIAVFLPARPAPLPTGEAAEAAFSAAWKNDDNLLTAWRQERFSKGLRVSGLSLAGLAGLMLLPAAPTRRGNEEEQNREAGEAEKARETEGSTH